MALHPSSFPLRAALVRASLAPVGIIVGLTLLYFAGLRESQVFWTNAGGYPVELRDTVMDTFYPLLLFYAAWLLLISYLLFAWPIPSLRFWWLEAAYTFALWGLMGVILFTVVENNIENLIEGRPFHDHSEQSR